MIRNDVHKKVIERFGWVDQVTKLISELDELKVELWEYLNSESNIDKVIDEFADVINMIEQFEIIAKQRELFTHLDIDKKQNEKMKRTVERIE